MARRLALVGVLAVAAIVSGCGSEQTGAEIPESASLAPADAVVFARLTTDGDSSRGRRPRASSSESRAYATHS